MIGITLLSCSKVIMGDLFTNALPDIVTSKFCAYYVMALRFLFLIIYQIKFYFLFYSAFNMIGRFSWASISDRKKKKNEKK